MYSIFFYIFFQEIEPIKLSWTENSKCFYSEEFKIPTGKYVGNLVIDGVFYPVEDIVVKHYTFEVDLYLKDGRYRSACVDPEGGRRSRPPPEKSQKIYSFLAILVRIPLKITKSPSQHSVLGHHQHASEMPFKCHLNNIMSRIEP